MRLVDRLNDSGGQRLVVGQFERHLDRAWPLTQDRLGTGGSTFERPVALDAASRLEGVAVIIAHAERVDRHHRFHDAVDIGGRCLEADKQQQLHPHRSGFESTVDHLISPCLWSVDITGVLLTR